MKYTDDQVKALEALGLTKEEIAELESGNVEFEQAKALGEKAEIEAKSQAEEAKRRKALDDTARKIVDRKRKQIAADDQKAADVNTAVRGAVDKSAKPATFEIVKADQVADDIEKAVSLGIDREKAVNSVTLPLRCNLGGELTQKVGQYTDEEKAGFVLMGALCKAVRNKRFAEAERIDEVISGERKKALSATVSGTPYLTPVGYEAAVIRIRDEATPFFQLFRRIPVTTPTGKIPVESALGTAYWAAEANAITAGDPTLAQLSWAISTLGALTIWSDYLDSAGLVNIGQYIAENHGRRFALALWDKLITGTGTNQPKGLSAETITQTAAQGATNLVANDVINGFYALPPQYRANAVWLIPDAAAKLIRKLRSSTTAEFLWGVGLQSGAPPTIEGRPIYANSYIAANTAGAYKLYLLDPSYYLYFEMEGMGVELATEYTASTDLFATGQVALKTTQLCDARLSTVKAVATLTGVK